MSEKEPQAETPIWGAKNDTSPPLSPPDRSQGWSDPVLETVYMPDSYDSTTETAVRFLPTTKDGKVLGYVWASVSEESANYVEKRDAGIGGRNAGVPWIRRLRAAKAEGLTALEALRRWVGAPEDPRAGGIPEDAVEQELPSLQALNELAARDDRPRRPSGP